MPHEQGLDLKGLVSLIKQHCLASDTGTLFLLTEKSATVKLVLLNGEIAALSYQSIRGEEAILPISQVQHCKTRYYAGVKLLPINKDLPKTDIILDLLQGKDKQAIDPTDTTQIITERSTQSDSSETVVKTLDAVLSILIDETTEFMGPFASVLCKKYMASANNPPTIKEIHTALRQLADDIRDESKSMQLEQNVLQRIQL
ncbi:MAG: hypothetical protein OQL27_02930 [Sedimenticola sp.]|nr:hypothetical protein [Sedimenticola sp.]